MPENVAPPQSAGETTEKPSLRAIVSLEATAIGALFFVALVPDGWIVVAVVATALIALGAMALLLPERGGVA